MIFNLVGVTRFATTLTTNGGWSIERNKPYCINNHFSKKYKLTTNCTPIIFLNIRDSVPLIQCCSAYLSHIYRQTSFSQLSILMTKLWLYVREHFWARLIAHLREFNFIRAVDSLRLFAKTYLSTVKSTPASIWFHHRHRQYTPFCESIIAPVCLHWTHYWIINIINNFD